MTETQTRPEWPALLGGDGAAYAIEVEGMSTRYGRAVPVRNLSMHVPRGSIYGLVGPSGSGKTATIRTLATLQHAETGRVLVDGIDIRTDPVTARVRIGYLPDSSGVYGGLTVAECMDFYEAIYRIPARRRKQLTDELLELLDLTPQRDQPVQWMSRGARQRLGLARCLIHDPPILMLDEPTSGMDARSRLEFRDIMLELRRLGKTILIGSNMLSELSAICTHLGVLRAGELLAEGAVDEIIEVAAPDARLRVRLLDAGTRRVARELLSSHPSCGRVEAQDSTLAAEFGGTEHDLVGILKALVSNGVQVTEFSVEGRTLEDVFLRLAERGPQT